MAIVDAAPQLARLPDAIAARLEAVRRRERSIRLVAGVLDGLTVFVVALLAALLIDWAFTLFNSAVRTALTCAACGIGGLALLLFAGLPLLKRRRLAEVAAEIDSSIPALEERWQTVTEIADSTDPPTMSGSAVLLRKVLDEAVGRQHSVDPRGVIPSRRLRRHQALLVAAIGVVLALFAVDAPRVWTLLRRFCLPTASISLTQFTAVTGDFEAARGEPVLLESTIDRRVTDSALLFLRKPDGTVLEIPLAPSADDPARFGHLIETADESFAFRFRAADAQTEWHHVSVYDRPHLTGIDFRIDSPVYTRLGPVIKSELPTHIRAVEGSNLEIRFAVDQPLDRFQVDLGKEMPAVQLAADPGDPLRYVFRRRLEKSFRLTPLLTSLRRLSNAHPPSCQLIVYPDLPPVVTIVSPNRDITLRPTDQVAIEINAHDDFGVVRGELVAYVGDAPHLDHALVLPAKSAAAPVKGGERFQGGTTAEGDKALFKGPRRGAARLQKDVPHPNDRTRVTNAARLSSPNSAGARRPTAAIDSASAVPTMGATGSASALPPTIHGKNEDGAASNPSAKTQANANDLADAASAPHSAAAADPRSSSAPDTIVVPLDFDGQTGEKDVRAMVNLDLGRFHLKQGEQLQYRVQVYDSRNAGSHGQAHVNQSKVARTAENNSKSNRRQSAGSDRRNEIVKNSPEHRAVAQNATDQHGGGGKGSHSERVGAPKKETGRPGIVRVEDSANRKLQADKRTADGRKPGKRPDADADGGSSGSNARENHSANPSDDGDSQATASSTMKIHIDESVGSYDEQQRRRIELAIDPVLKDLNAALTKGIQELKPVAAAVGRPATRADDLKRLVAAVDAPITRAQQLVAELVEKSNGTSYAFIGLQLVNITEQHISPARLEIKAIKPEAADKPQRVRQAEFHLLRAREKLADLTRRYETVKRDMDLADEMQRVKTMYRVVTDDAMKMLGSKPPSDSQSKQRKVDELELDEEYLKAYQELADRWQETLAELAKALAKDPRLLARYINQSQRSVQSLRTKLTTLKKRQQELMVPVDQLARELPAERKPRSPAVAVRPGARPTFANRTGEKHNQDKQFAQTEQIPPKVLAPQKKGTSPALENIKASLARELHEIAAGTTAVQEDLNTWLPRGMASDDPRITPLKDLAAKAAAAALVAEEALTQPDGPAVAGMQVGDFIAQLKQLEAALANPPRPAGTAPAAENQLQAHLNRRADRLRKLQQSAEVWAAKNALVQKGDLQQALQIDEHRLSDETLDFMGRLENSLKEVSDVSDDVPALANELKELLQFDVVAEEMSAELGLQDHDLSATKEHQKSAVDGFARVEQKLNKLIDRIIEEQNKLAAEVPDVDQMQNPSLEQLLAELENEQDRAEDELGIPQRHNNLQNLRDWLMKQEEEEGGTGSGQGNGSAGNGGSNGGSGNAGGGNSNGGRPGGSPGGHMSKEMARRLAGETARRMAREKARQMAERMAREMAERARQRAAMALRAQQEALHGAQRAQHFDDVKLPASAARWNTLSSRLEDAVRQGRGNTPPRQYRRAIERYFELISSAKAAEPAAETGATRPNPTIAPNRAVPSDKNAESTRESATPASGRAPAQR